MKKSTVLFWKGAGIMLLGMFGSVAVTVGFDYLGISEYAQLPSLAPIVFGVLFGVSTIVDSAFEQIDERTDNGSDE